MGEVTTLADTFAVSVQAEWETELRLRRLNDPYPLPVAWHTAPAELAEPWNAMAARPGARLTGGTEGLAGQYEEIGTLFRDRLPFRRLILLGEPGSGKSMLLVRLLLDLCAERRGGDPVPVLFSLSSWNPATEELGRWLERQLCIHHPALAARHGGVTGARALLDHRLVLPLLDGFDEMAPHAQAVGLDALNQALPVERPFVLASRTAEYLSALEPDDGVPVRLNGAAAIVLEPLDTATSSAYLIRDAGGAHSSATGRWAPVLTRLGANSPAAAALKTPLALFLARTIYNPRPGEGCDGLPDPGEICDESRFPDASAVHIHLFRSYVPAAYRPHPQSPCPWSAEQAQRYLAILAGQLERRGSGTEIAWWELASGPSRGIMVFLKVIALTVLTFLCFGCILLIEGIKDYQLYGPVYGYEWNDFMEVSLDQMGAGFLASVILSLVFVLLLQVAGREVPAVKLRWRPTRSSLRRTALVGCGGGIFIASIAFDLPDRMAGFLVSVFLASMLTGWQVAPMDITRKTSPLHVLSEDRRSLVALSVRMAFLGLLGGPLVFAVIILINWVDPSSWSNFTPVHPFEIVAISGLGLSVSMPFTAAIALHRTASAPWFLVRHYYAFRGLLPRDLLAFLRDAHEKRGVLRQVGAIYQFRHIHLQQQLRVNSFDPR
ncbi:NACHT domain-containing protein [Streptomyces axinellae]|uniref:NACHT domain-containing protein n=2 Tax=Streptomyces axinellae TaxID=552788 RepID=A0ABP6DCB9_9ACTN